MHVRYVQSSWARPSFVLAPDLAVGNTHSKPKPKRRNSSPRRALLCAQARLPSHQGACSRLGLGGRVHPGDLVGVRAGVVDGNSSDVVVVVVDEGDGGANVDRRRDPVGDVLDELGELAPVQHLLAHRGVDGGRAGEVVAEVAVLSLGSWVGDLSHVDRRDTIWKEGWEVHDVHLGNRGAVGRRGFPVRCWEARNVDFPGCCGCPRKMDRNFERHFYDLIVISSLMMKSR
jgi:hypothetical protein